MTLPLMVRYVAGLLDQTDIETAGLSHEQVFAMKQGAPVVVREAPLTTAPDTIVTRAAGGSEGGTVVAEFAATVEIADRAGDLVQVRRKKGVGGPRLDHFKAAGSPLLWAHNRSEELPPIGTVRTFKTKQIDFPGYGKRWALVEGTEIHPTTDMGRVAGALVEEGTLRTVSIGFVPLKVDVVDDEEKRKALGLGPWGVHFLEWDQVELSLTPTPMNPLAMRVEQRALLDTKEAELRMGLTRLVERGILPAALVRDFVSAVLPLDRERLAAERVRSFVDMARDITGASPADMAAPARAAGADEQTLVVLGLDADEPGEPLDDDAGGESRSSDESTLTRSLADLLGCEAEQSVVLSAVIALRRDHQDAATELRDIRARGADATDLTDQAGLRAKLMSVFDHHSSASALLGSLLDELEGRSTQGVDRSTTGGSVGSSSEDAMLNRLADLLEQRGLKPAPAAAPAGHARATSSTDAELSATDLAAAERALERADRLLRS